MLCRFLLILISYEKSFIFVLLFINSFLKCLLSFDCNPDTELGSGNTVLSITSLWRTPWRPHLGKEIGPRPGSYKCNRK